VPTPSVVPAVDPTRVDTDDHMADAVIVILLSSATSANEPSAETLTPRFGSHSIGSAMDGEACSGGHGGFDHLSSGKETRSGLRMES
jgi:hypothetical protein